MTNAHDTNHPPEKDVEFDFPVPDRAATGVEVERAQLIKSLRRAIENAQAMTNHYQNFARNLELLLLTEQNMR